MPGKKVLITGANGFIGKNLTKFLSDTFAVTAPKKTELDLLNAEAVSAFLSSNNFDVIVHLASVGVSRSNERAGILEANKTMFLNLAGQLKPHQKMIFLGSGAEYGKQEPIVNVKETDFGKIKPKDEYGQAKYFASEYIAEHTNIINLRCFGVYGKYEDYATRFISNAICHSLFNQPILVRQNSRFSYIYINDLVKIIEYFILNEAKHKFYNVGQPGIEILELARMVKQAAGGGEIKVLYPGLNKEYTCDSSLLKQELGNVNFTSFEIAISEMVNWYKDHKKDIDINKLGFDG